MPKVANKLESNFNEYNAKQGCKDKIIIKRIEFLLDNSFIHKNKKGVIVIKEVIKDIKINLKDNNVSALYPIDRTKML